MSQEFHRDYLIRLPLPLAQLYSRAHNAKDARSRHDNTFYLLEALVKLAVAPAAAAYLDEVRHGAARDEAVDRELVKLALPSLGQWVGMLRGLARHFGGDDRRASHPLGPRWEQLNRPRHDREMPAAVALYQRIKNGPDGQLAHDRACSLLQLLDALVQYRNGVFGHGGARFESFYDREMGPLLFPAANELLAEEVFDPLGPPGSRLIYLTELRVVDEGRAELGLRDLVGLEGERAAPLVLELRHAAGLAPHRVAVLWPGHPLPLSLDPLLLYRENEVSPELLFLNRDRAGGQVEYLNYRSGRTERESSSVRALAALLGRITGGEVGEPQLRALAEQTRAQTAPVEVPPPPEPAAQVVGDYEVLAEVGRGSMGVVYLARQRSLGRLVALKMLPDDLAGDELALARFRREVAALARCEHPNIVKVFDKGQLADGRLYYTMEYVPGCTLEQVWQELSGSHRQGDASHLGTSTWTRAVLTASRKQRDRTAARSSGGAPAASGTAAPAVPLLPLPPLPDLPDAPDDAGGYARRVALLVRDAALALQAVHEQHIVHRDVKPANLVLTPDGSRLVLMDFGLVKGQTTSLTVSGHGGLLGTLRYAAPEQLAAATRKVGAPADVRGLGVTLWELLTRRRLFDEAADEAQLADLIADHDVPLLSTVDPTLPRDLEAIVARATERRVADRIQTAGELAEYLQLFLDDKPLPIRRPSAGELVWRWARAHRALVGSVAAAALAILVTTAVAFVLIVSALNRETEANRNSQAEHRKRALAQVETLLTAEPASVPAILENLEPFRGDVFPRLRELSQKEDLPEKQRVRVHLALLPEDPGLAGPLRDALLKAEPQELLVIRKALLPYRDELKAGLWQVAENPAAPGDQRFRAACALAAYDPDGDGWGKIGPDVVAMLVTQNPLVLADWVEALRPARAALLDQLTGLYGDRERGEECYVAATILGDYTADRPDLLADLLLDADARQFATLLPRLPADGATRTRMSEELSRTLAPDWGDPPADPSWAAPAAALVEKIDKAQGMLTERFALCQVMPFDEFLQVAEGLRPAGYRPVRCRPYRIGSALHVAAAWLRDGRDWQMAHGLSAEQMRQQDADWRAKGYLPVDVAGYVEGAGGVRYLGLWVEDSLADVKLFVGLTGAEHDTAVEPFTATRNYHLPVALQEVIGADGVARYSSIWQRTSLLAGWKREWVQCEFFYEGWLTPSHLQVDVGLVPAPPPPAHVDPYAALTDVNIAELEEFKSTGEFYVRFVKGVELLAQGKDREAVAELSASIDRLSVWPLAYSFRAIAHARLGNLDQARRDLASSREHQAAFFKSNAELAYEGTWYTWLVWRTYADTVASAYLGDDEAAMKRLEAFVAPNAGDGTALFVAARACAAAARVVARAATPERQARAKRYVGRAVMLLREAAAHGFPGLNWEWETGPDLDAAREDLAFVALRNRLHLDRRYCAVWYTRDRDFEGQESHGLPPDQHLRRCRELAARGYRPAALAVARMADQSLVTASVWHRPLVPDRDSDALARRKVNAALALFRLGRADQVWSRLRAAPDPGERAQLIQRLGTLPGGAQAILDRLWEEPDLGARQALLLALDSCPENSFPADLRQSAAARLLQTYRDDPDPGIHAAAGWLLRRWGRGDELGRADEQLISGEPTGGRRWYVNGHGHTLAVIPGPVGFWMGSPGREARREVDEVSHPTRIGRTFAIATTETTIDQFRRFRPDHAYDVRSSPPGSGPVIEVTWYDAARYCRWLSEQEDIPKDQMCYPPVDQIGPDMVLPADYLSRTGYRLPTEAEWEYACRAGAATARPFGEGGQLLSAYARYEPNSGDHAWRVGRLKPNDLGLFDMLGNVAEWCADPYADYKPLAGGLAANDAPPAGPAKNRVCRGGSFLARASNVRCAVRFSNAADDRFRDVGFRVARTLPPSKEYGPGPPLAPEFADYVEALGLTPGADTYRGRADLYFARGAYDQAIADYTESLRLNPKSAHALVNRGESYRLKGAFDKAVADCDAALRLDAKSAAAYATRGAAHLALRDYDHAIADLSAALALQQNYAFAYANRAAAYVARGEQDKAAADMAEAIRLGPDAVETSGWLTIQALAAQGKREEAMSLVDQLCRARPQDWRVLALRGHLQLALGQEAAAVTTYEDVLRRADKDESVPADRRAQLVAAVRFNLSVAYGELGQVEKACGQLKVLLEKDPDNPAYNNDLGFLWADRDMNLKEAEKLIRKAIDLDRAQRRKANPDLKPEDDKANPLYLDSLAWVLYKQKRYAEAKAQLLGAVEGKEAQTVDVFDHLGEVQQALGAKADALAAWKKAVEVAGPSPHDRRRKAAVEKKLKDRQ
jgi:formylglycine-generating enzyme required for sulfatase activity/serine/threonine protein kinase/Tfp pilus assembly protein PilF